MNQTENEPMQFFLVVAIYSASTGLSLETLPALETKAECLAMAKVYEARATHEVGVRTRCVGVPNDGWF